MTLYGMTSDEANESNKQGFVPIIKRETWYYTWSIVQNSITSSAKSEEELIVMRNNKNKVMSHKAAYERS